MKSPCVAYPEHEPLVLIRASQVRLCDGNHCAAALLSYFGYWHTIRLEQSQQAEHANKVAALHGEAGTQETTLLQYHTEDAIETGMLHLYGRKTIRAAIAVLVSKGFLSIHGNPNPRYRFDKTHYFLFHPGAVQAELGMAVHEVKVPDREGKNTSSDFTGDNGQEDEESEYSVHEVKVPDREGVFAASSGKNAAPIEEITSEITEEELREDPHPSLPKEGTESMREDITNFLKEMLSKIPPLATASASAFHYAIVDELRSAHFDVDVEYPVHDRGDGKPGKIDILIKAPWIVGIEVDAVTPRQKSVYKLQRVRGMKVIILREAGNTPEPQDGIDVILRYPHPEVTELAPPQQTRRSRTKASQMPNTEYTPAFNKVWALYPRKEKKVETFTIWRERNLEARGPEIAEKLARLQVTLWKHKEMQYIPLPTTWFNEARYEDDLIPMDTAINQQRPQTLSYAEQKRQREAEAARQFLGGDYAGPTGSTSLPDGNDQALDGIEYRRIDG